MKIKSMKSFVSIIDQETNEIQGEEFLSYQETYNQHELVKEEVEQDQEGNILARATYAYDEKGNILERSSFVEGNILNEKEIFTRNADGTVESIEIQYGEGSFSRRIYSREDDRITIKIVDDQGSVEGSEERVHNADGEIIDLSIFDAEGNIDSAREASYDEQKNILELKVYGREKELVEWQRFEYNEANLEVKRTLYSVKGELRGGVSSEYDEKGRISRMKAVDKGSATGNYERLMSYEEGETESEEWMELYDGSENLIRQHYKKYDLEGRLLLEENSKAGTSSFGSHGATGGTNYFLTRNEYEFFD